MKHFLVFIAIVVGAFILFRIPAVSIIAGAVIMVAIAAALIFGLVGTCKVIKNYFTPLKPIDHNK